MTGRDLIIYILQNDLEDEPVYKDGSVLGFMTVAEAASKFDVGTATVRLWCSFGMLDSVRIGNQIYIPVNAKPNQKESTK